MLVDLRLIPIKNVVEHRPREDHNNSRGVVTMQVPIVVLHVPMMTDQIVATVQDALPINEPLPVYRIIIGLGVQKFAAHVFVV